MKNLKESESKNEKRVFLVKAYNKKQLCEVLNLSRFEFEKITKPHSDTIGERMGNYYTPKQVRAIVEVVKMHRNNK